MKNNWRSRIKQVEALKALKPEENRELETTEGRFPKGIRNNKIKNKWDKITEWEEKIKRKGLICKTNEYKYDFQQYETIRSFGESIYAGKSSTDEAEQYQSNLLENIIEFNEKSRPRTKEGKDKKRNTYESAYVLYERRESTLNAFRSRIFPIKSTQGKGLKRLALKQMLQRLPIALAQVKAGNISENLLNEIRQIIYSLYRAKEIPKKVYNNIMNSIKV